MVTDAPPDGSVMVGVVVSQAKRGRKKVGSVQAVYQYGDRYLFTVSEIGLDVDE